MSTLCSGGNWEAALARWGLNAQEYEEKISQVVEGTDGLGILYEGRPIQALFFSSAAGRTVDAVAVWGNSVDYLKSVDSPEGDEVPNYHSQVVLSSRQVQEAALAAYPGADLSGEPSSWFGPAVRDEGGTVTSIPFGGLTLTGGQVRSMLSLRYRDLGRGKFYLRRYWLRPRGRHEPVWSQQAGPGGHEL